MTPTPNPTAELLETLGKLVEHDTLRLLVCLARLSSSQGHMLRVENGDLLIVATAEPEKVEALRGLIRELDPGTTSAEEARDMVVAARMLDHGWRPEAEAADGGEADAP